MNIEAIDSQLEQWNSDLQRLQLNLLELQQNYGRMLVGDGSALSGSTKRKYLEVAERENLLWVNTELFSNLLKLIKEKRNALGFLPGREKIEEIRELIHGQSIELSSQKVSLESRDLFSEGTPFNRTSASALKATMQDDFRLACDFYSRVETSWRQLEATITPLNQQAAGLVLEAAKYADENSAKASAILALKKKLQALSEQWRNDPLGISTDVRRDLAPFLKEAEKQVKSLADEHLSMSETLEQCRTKSQELLARQERAKQLYDDCVNRFVFSQSTAPKVPPSASSLNEQVTTLFALFAEKNLTALPLELEKWRNEYQKLVRSIDRALDENAKLLEQPTVLKQIFLATVAKYKDYAARGMAIPNSVTVFTDRGQTLIRTKTSEKVDLEALRTIVNALAVKVGELCLKFDGQAKQTQKP